MIFRNLKFSLIILFSILTVQCAKDLEEEKLIAENKRIESYLADLAFQKENGVYHAIVTSGYGYQIVPGDSIAFWYKGYTLDNKVFETNILSVAVESKLDTITRSFDPVEMVAGSGILIEGLNRGIILCRGDETSKILFSSLYGFGDQNIGPIPAWSPLGYDISIIYVTNDDIKNEQQILNELLDNSNQRYILHDMGFWYSKLSSNIGGVNPTLADTIYGWYSGTLPNGNVFDEIQGLNQEIILSNSDLTFGLAVGFTLLRTGERASLIVPSPVAYGVEGEGIVEPYTPVIYQIRLDSIK